MRRDRYLAQGLIEDEPRSDWRRVVVVVVTRIPANVFINIKSAIYAMNKSYSTILILQEYRSFESFPVNLVRERKPWPFDGKILLP